MTDARELRLQAFNHLRQIDGGEAWEAYGNDPAFVVDLPDGGLDAGWYELEVDLEHLAGPEMVAFLYPDLGLEDIEENKIFLPFLGNGQPSRGVVLFPLPVRALRFDPAIAVCQFRLGKVRLRRIGRREAAVDMLRNVFDGTRKRGRGSIALELAQALVRGGFRQFARRLNAIYALPEGLGAGANYEIWLDLYDRPARSMVADIRREVAKMPAPPLVSVVLPVYETPAKWLEKCIDSVVAQAYPHWELCIADDASKAPHVREILQRRAAADPRIKVVHRERNGHISESSNSALALATGQWVVLLDHDDELHPAALWELVRAAARHPRWRLVYTDEDKIDEEGRRYDPYMKPDWNYDLFLSHNCISHLGCYDAALLREVGGFRKGMEGSQDWDLALRCIERLDHDQVGHVPKVLYHWRAIEGSTALAPGEKDYAHLAGIRSIQEHLDRIGSTGRVHEIDGQRGNYRVRYPVPSPAPLASLVIPTRDRLALVQACVESVLALTDYPAYEIVIVDNQSTDPATLAWFEEVQRAETRVRVVRYDAPFNYPAVNNFGVGHAKGELVCLLNNDITVITPGWLTEMAGHALRPEVGAVGAMLYYPNDTIQHAGVILGAHGIAAHAYSGMPRGYPGHMSRGRLAQSLTAVTAACLVVRREVYEEVGGLDPVFEVAFNDIDLCLRIAAAGYRNIWTPFAELYHHESASRGYEDSPEKIARFAREISTMRARWPEVIAHDPMYSPNHSIVDRLHELAFPPRVDGVRWMMSGGIQGLPTEAAEAR